MDALAPDRLGATALRIPKLLLDPSNVDAKNGV
jgi:hypothetical protein